MAKRTGHEADGTKRAVRSLKHAILLLAAIACRGTETAATAAPVNPDADALAGAHPAQYYERAEVLFEQGKQDEAVFLFYLGQLRYRVYLSAHSDLAPDGDPALFASLSESVGRPLNEYAFGDVPSLARTIDDVLAYDRAHPDSFTPPAKFPKAHAEVCEGLASLKDAVLTRAEEIRAMRRQGGLQNRS